MVFAGSTFYPNGGFRDFLTSVDTLDDAQRAIAGQRLKPDWWQIVASESGEIVKEEGERLRSFFDEEDDL